MEYIPGILFFLLILIILAIIAPPLICLMAGGIDVLLVLVVWLLNWLDSAIVFIWELITAAVGLTIQAPAAVIIIVCMIVLWICKMITDYESGDDLYEEDPETGEKRLTVSEAEFYRIMTERAEEKERQEEIYRQERQQRREEEGILYPVKDFFKIVFNIILFLALAFAVGALLHFAIPYVCWVLNKIDIPFSFISSWIIGLYGDFFIVPEFAARVSSFLAMLLTGWKKYLVAAGTVGLIAWIKYYFF